MFRKPAFLARRGYIWVLRRVNRPAYMRMVQRRWERDMGVSLDWGDAA